MPTGCPTGTTTRRWRRCSVPASSATGRCAGPRSPPGGRLGIYGFGGSAHLTAQVAIAEYGARVHVLTRSAGRPPLARRPRCRFRGGCRRRAAGTAGRGHHLRAGRRSGSARRCAALDRGGILAVAGIHLTDVPSLNYQDELFYERELRSVTANTRQDGRGLPRPRRPSSPGGDDAALPTVRADQALPTWPPTGSPALPSSWCRTRARRSAEHTPEHSAASRSVGTVWVPM